jgi:hypothetical protein
MFFVMLLLVGVIMYVSLKMLDRRKDNIHCYGKDETCCKGGALHDCQEPKCPQGEL